jgi:AraC-like DNA-binding protein
MVELDALFRGATIGITLLLGAAFWRARPNSAVAWIWLFFTIAASAHVLAGALEPLNWRPLARLGVGVLALSAPFFFWLFARLVFDDEFRLRPAQFLWLGLIEAAGVVLFVLRGNAAPWLLSTLGFGFRLPSLALVAHALWVVWKGRPADLVEARARLRVVVVVGAGIVTALVLLTAILYAPLQNRTLPFNLGEAVTFMVIDFAVAIGLLGLIPDFLPSAPGAISSRLPSPSGAGNAASTAHGLSTADAETLSRLDSVMAREEAWRETGLTIGALAKRIGIPEYRLRRLINQHLGFRNFTAFLNAYRLAAAAERLADREQARTPILTIALDLGWGSIGPFNRAFRARFGVPPSDYRREQTQTPQERQRSSRDS